MYVKNKIVKHIYLSMLEECYDKVSGTTDDNGVFTFVAKSKNRSFRCYLMPRRKVKNG